MQNENTLTIDQLIEAGQCLYGDQWQSNLARTLSIDSRRIRQWLNSERPMPDWLLDELIRLLDDNATSTLALKQNLEKLK